MARAIICMSLLEKTDDYAVYEYGESMSNLDGKIKLSIQKPREEHEILEESSIGGADTGLALSKLIRVIESGEVPEKVCRAS